MAMQGRIDVTTIASRVLEGNKLGDPTERELLVYLPPGYDESRGRYPTITMLPGFPSNHRSLLRYDFWKENTVELYDRLVTTGTCTPALLVLPDAMTRWGGSQYLDSAATGRYQTYLADEVVVHVDATYRSIPKREARAVVGRSSGGFGALRLGMDRPEVFGVVGSHAGDAAFEVSLRPLFTPAAIELQRAGGVEAFCESVAASGPSGSQYDTLFFVAAAAAYAPEPDRPAPHAALPFDPETAEPIPDVWERWLEHDPVKRLSSSADALRRAALVYLDAGDGDEYGLCFAARQLRRGLDALGARVHYEEFEGGHRGTSGRYEVSLPILAAALAID